MSQTPGKGGLIAAGLGWGVALGIVLGAVLLAPAVPRDSAGAGAGAGAADAQSALAEQRAEAANDLLAQESVSIVHGALTDVPVTIIRTPSAADDDVESVRWLLNAAGASDSGLVELQEKFTSQSSADELSSIVANTLPSGAQLSVDDRAPGRHAGESLGAVLFADPDTGAAAAQAADRALVLETLQQAGFIRYAGSVVPAGAVVVVHGASETAGGGFGEQMLGDFAEALGQSGTAVFATQDADPEQIAGAATVGMVDLESGRIGAVLAAAK